MMRDAANARVFAAQVVQCTTHCVDAVVFVEKSLAEVLELIAAHAAINTRDPHGFPPPAASGLDLHPNMLDAPIPADEEKRIALLQPWRFLPLS
ncbi:MAG TPA: hypothetical protein VI072_21140 [Polyangiaceae bacterium]